jgi:hypothetical protein
VPSHQHRRTSDLDEEPCHYISGQPGRRIESRRRTKIGQPVCPSDTLRGGQAAPQPLPNNRPHSFDIRAGEALILPALTRPTVADGDCLVIEQIAANCYLAATMMVQLRTMSFKGNGHGCGCTRKAVSSTRCRLIRCWRNVLTLTSMRQALPGTGKAPSSAPHRLPVQN